MSLTLRSIVKRSLPGGTAAVSRFLVIAVGLIGVTSNGLAQELRVQPTPFSVWLDFSAIGGATRSKASLPIWIESVQREHTLPTATIAEKTTFRIRLRRLGNLNGEIQLRLFFDDLPDGNPSLSGWTETGQKQYIAKRLGEGLNLPTSEKVTIPVTDLDYLEIDAPGDGASVRGAFLSTLRKYEGRHALDFEPLATIDDPFGGDSGISADRDDTYLYGRVKATIDSTPVKLSPRETPSSTLEFELDAAPLVAMITFEVLDAEALYPPELSINGRSLGRVSLRLPDLADPGYQGSVRPLETDMRFRYTGWIRCQQIVAGSSLLSGLNKLEISLNKDSGPVAIRNVEIELKHHWENFDYRLAP